MDKNFRDFALLFVFIIVIGGLSYYLLFFYKSNKTLNSSEKSFLELKKNPDYLVQENLLKIKNIELLEYFRQRLNYHSYSNEKKGLEGLKQELAQDFSGERSTVLISLLENYLKFEESKKKIQDSNELDPYEKIEKTSMIKIEIFGQALSELLFIEKDSDLIQKFYSYAYRYLKKHYTDLPKSKRNHLEKAKQEIYGNKFESLQNLETAKKKLELEIMINERELSILTAEERKIVIEEYKEKLKEFSK
jgi:hypothetical protein